MENEAAGPTWLSPARIAPARPPSDSGRGARGAGAEPGYDERDAEKKRHQPLDGVVRVELLDRRLADDQAEPAGDARSEQEPAQEGDAVRARAVASDDDERRRQDERAGGGDDRVEQDVKGRMVHIGRWSTLGRGLRRDAAPLSWCLQPRRVSWTAAAPTSSPSGTGSSAG